MEQIQRGFGTLNFKGGSHEILKLMWDKFHQVTKGRSLITSQVIY